MKTGYLNHKTENPDSLAKDLLPESKSASRLNGEHTQTESSTENSSDKPPIYTVSKDTDEYHLRREQQHKDGLKTLVRSLLLFGILAAMWLILQHSLK